MAIDNCKIICDLLPSYIDGICSEDTRIEVDNHLKICDNCKHVYEKMTQSDIEPMIMDKAEMKKVTEPFRKINTRYHIKVLSCVIAAFVIIGIAYAIIIPGRVPSHIDEQHGKQLYWKHIDRLVNITELHYFLSGYIDNTVDLESNVINHAYGYVTFDGTTALLNVRYDCTFSDGSSAIVHGYYAGKHYIFGIIAWESNFYVTHFIESE